MTENEICLITGLALGTFVFFWKHRHDKTET